MFLSLSDIVGIYFFLFGQAEANGERRNDQVESLARDFIGWVMASRNDGAVKDYLYTKTRKRARVLPIARGCVEEPKR